ncbi:MAG: hypothetical protein AB1916_15860 [Thermodesulfobacteriota bacterium]
MPRIRISPLRAAGFAVLALLPALVLLLAPAPARALSASAGGGEAPAVLDRLFKDLAKGLQAFAIRLDAIPPAGPHPGPRFFAPLTTADGRRGQDLLEYGGMEGNLVMLDALQHLGVHGVALSIPYPLLAPGQPRAQEYMEFYSRLAAEIRKRSLALYVHMTPAFRSPAYARQKGDAPFAALDRLALAAGAQAEAVLAALRPDILGLISEPSAAAEDAGMPELSTTEGLGRFLDNATRRLARNGTRIAAGLGSWERPELAAALAASSVVDILDIHVCAVRSRKTDFLAQADEYAQLARLLGKQAALGEVWLSKTSSFEFGSRRSGRSPDSQEVLRRDMYGFWSPLDIAFLDLMVRLARIRGLEFVCPSRPQHLFAYLEYQPGLEKTAFPALARKADAAAFAAMRRDDLSRTGEAFRRLIRDGRP